MKLWAYLSTIKLPWLWIIAAFSLSGVIHIATVLSLPYVAERDAWARLSAISSINQFYTLPSDADNAPLPLMAPDVASAFCRFDLSQKNVLLRPYLADATWTLAIYTRYGENFYVITGAEARRKDLRLLLVPRERLARETVTEKTEEGEDQIIVITPSDTGIALMHAPVRSGDFLNSTATALNQTTCEPQKETDAQLLASGAQDKVLPTSTPVQNPAKKNRKGTRSYR
ncbi:MAG: hypothetical protein SGJ17_00500 [Hyphomicrobiales bacterium]|nr:hypothetical protein [Hyphomicrobiales bacterium]